MIITEKKPIEEITGPLRHAKARSVYLFGCNSCAEQCKTGGEPELKEMTETLTKEGFEVTGNSLPDETCYHQIVKKDFRLRPEIKASDAVVVLACGAGVKVVADNAAEAQPVLPALDSKFLASVERVGRFFEGCSLCGECVLDSTGGICPHTDCPKGLLNGPCGGVADGYCEINTDNECAWIRIYNRLKAQGRLDIMRAFTPPKDRSNSINPRQMLLR